MSVGFIGAGRIALALSRGFVRAGLMKPANIVVSAPRGVPSSLPDFKKLGATTSHNNMDVAEQCKVIFLTTKASLIPKVLYEITPRVDSNKLLISLAAGVTLDAMEACLPPESRVVRVMSNTPCLVNEAATTFSSGRSTTKEDCHLALKLLSSVGYCVEVDESMMDAVCGLSGSGPAYVHIFIEAMTDGGVRMGLPRELALRLATQTVLGAAKMISETGEHPSQLKDNVCSPGGSTIAALHGLDSSGFRGLLIDAVRDATIRTSELSELANQGIEQDQRLPKAATPSNGNGNGNKKFISLD